MIINNNNNAHDNNNDNDAGKVGQADLKIITDTDTFTPPRRGGSSRYLLHQGSCGSPGGGGGGGGGFGGGGGGSGGGGGGWGRGRGSR
ncbi:hypothetical protein E2C01_098231 [Portunus trituberculatus]|uniref:Uncharacterized protein n=1 Tax=Portunus trituberculatus TaxID=210409 RepID=A0A5B7KDH3_PORTR|nr:hypothetical protein [Portunus trituberculatus]